MSGGQLSPNTKLLNNPYGYNGEYHDLESGFQYLRARYYNPETARFITRDSYLGEINEPLTLNRYAYTSNNPVMKIDPSGHKDEYAGDGGGSSSSTPTIQPKKAATNNYPTLQMNSSYDRNVEILQNKLNIIGYNLKVDGYFGPETYDAVTNFQLIENIGVDGIVGNITWGRVDKVSRNIEETGISLGVYGSFTATSGKDGSSGYVEKKAEQRTSYNNKGCGDEESISKFSEAKDYILKSGEQIVLGNYTENVTLLGTAGQIGTGLLGVDLPGDIRDISADVVNWKWSWDHAGRTAVDVVALLPVVGALKYSDEVGTLVKNADEVVNNTNLDSIRIINKKYAGKTYKLSDDLYQKYPKGVRFTDEGFPDFKPYSIKTVTVDNLEGDAYYDFIKANEKAGFNSTPEGYTWHHVEDGRTMELVPSDLHGEVRHTGGASLIRKGIRP